MFTTTIMVCRDDRLIRENWSQSARCIHRKSATFISKHMYRRSPTDWSRAPHQDRESLGAKSGEDCKPFGAIHVTALLSPGSITYNVHPLPPLWFDIASTPLHFYKCYYSSDNRPHSLSSMDPRCQTRSCEPLFFSHQRLPTLNQRRLDTAGLTSLLSQICRDDFSKRG